MTTKRPSSRPTGSKSARPEPASAPRLQLVNRQRRYKLDLPSLRDLGARAMQQCHKQRGPGLALLDSLSEIEVSFVSDRVISKVHLDFSGVPGATDVITFLHGELVISVDTASKASRESAEPILRELLRYIVHGLLHLNGFLDAEPAHRRAMWRVQELVVRRVWKGGRTN